LAIASFAAKRIGLDATVARSAIRPRSAEDFFFSAAAFEAAEEEEDSSDATTAARVVVVVVVVVIFADTDRVFAAETPRNGDAAPRRRAEDVFATTRAETAEEVIIVVAAIVRANARRVVVCARARLGPALFSGRRGGERCHVISDLPQTGEVRAGFPRRTWSRGWRVRIHLYVLAVTDGVLFSDSIGGFFSFRFRSLLFHH
jgi:hypothetical protein